MSFKLFIYYGAVCGGWAAFAAWGLVDLLNIQRLASATLRTVAVSALVGFALAATVGTLDALLNSARGQRAARISVCLVVGLLGGVIGGTIGQLFQNLGLPLFLSWMIVGMAIGSSVGVFDVVRAIGVREPVRAARRKLVNGVIGGALGGLVGGVLYAALAHVLKLPRSSVAIGLVILGTSIGLLIGLAQIILKEAWIKVEKGFRAGREMMLSKPETTIGRAETCDIGLFGDAEVERSHARIILHGNRYLLADAGSLGGTFLNDQPVTQPVPLRSGDVIRVGSSLLRFGERQKRPQ